MECIYYLSQHPCNIKKYYCYYLLSSLVVEVWGTQPTDYRGTPTTEDHAKMRLENSTFVVMQCYAWVAKPCLSRVPMNANEEPHKPGIAWGALTDRPCVLHSLCCVLHHAEALP